MEPSENPQSKATIDTGESTEARQLIKNVKTYDNLDQNIIRITEDKVELILMKSLRKIEDKKAWITPFGVFIALLLIFLTTENFRDFLSIPAAVWQAGCYIAMIIFFCWTLFSVYKALKGRKISIDSIINELKQSQNHN